MIPVSIASLAVKARYKHIRTVEANCSNYIAKDILLTPMLKSFVETLRESEIDYPREHLVDTVVSTGCQQLLSANQSKRVIQLRADRIRATFSTVEGQEARADALIPREPSEQRTIFVVWMGSRMQYRYCSAQAKQRAPRRSTASVLRYFLYLRICIL